MKQIFMIFFLCFGSSLGADHVPPAQSKSPLDQYQHDAAKKRYADILKITDLVDEYIALTDTVPQLSSSGDLSNAEAPIYEVAILGQKEAVNATFKNGTPFGFSLVKFRPEVLLDVLRQGLARRVLLPLDPQRVGTHFAPVYFVFFRRAFADIPSHYIVMGTFAQAVSRSTMVADGVHIVAISNASVPFIVPVLNRDSFDAAFLSHVIEAGRDADARFARHVTIGLE